MKLAIMQPYIFPYIGYFHLLEATDRIVFYDDVTFIKGGWINRNRILLGKNDSLFTVPLSKASSHRLINETQIHPTLYPIWKTKFLKTLKQSYTRAPFYEGTFTLVEGVLNTKHENISDLAIHSITAVCNYLDRDIVWERSSVRSPTTRDLDKADRIIEIAKHLDISDYVNLAGGQDLYDKQYFAQRSINLHFIQSHEIRYVQFKNEFVPSLSIIDALMFNDKQKVKDLLTEFSLQ